MTRNPMDASHGQSVHVTKYKSITICYTHARTHMPTSMHAHTYTHTHAHKHAHKHTHTHTNTYTYMQTHTHTHTHMHAHAHKHAHKHTHKHKHIHIHARTRTRTHTHTHIQSCVHEDTQECMGLTGTHCSCISYVGASTSSVGDALPTFCQVALCPCTLHTGIPGWTTARSKGSIYRSFNCL